jgi:hypothetical protein
VLVRDFELQEMILKRVENFLNTMITKRGTATIERKRTLLLEIGNENDKTIQQ